MKDKSTLIAMISEAFGDVVLGDGIGLREANAIDDYKDMAFRMKCREEDVAEGHWHRISSSVLNQYYNGLHHLDAKGMRFYLPAFMIAVVKGVYRFSLSFLLTNPSSSSQFELLSSAQRQAVGLFMKYLSDRTHDSQERLEIEDAIVRYWSGALR